MHPKKLAPSIRMRALLRLRKIRNWIAFFDSN